MLDGQGASASLDAPHEDEALPFTRSQTLLTMAGVLMVMLLSSLDQTIVATAMPHIIVNLHGFEQYTWVTTGYLLASTVMVPIYGKLSDLFGRKPIFLIGVVIFLSGSALSGAAQSMTQLILFRGLQGLGAGALMPLAQTVVGDLFSPRERGKWQGLTGAIFGLASILGPTLGGWISDSLNWRWVFYVNLPIGIVAMLVLIFLMPPLRPKNRNARIDYLGCALIALGTVPLLLGFTWAGSAYPWLSWQILGLIFGGVVVLSLFVGYEAALERRGGSSIIEPTLFKSSIFAVSALLTVFIAVGLYGCIAFIPLFVQGVIGTSATNSGVILMPLLLTAMVASILSGQLVSRYGTYKWLVIVSLAISVVGLLLLFRLDVHAGNSDVLIGMLVFGFGIGVGQSLYTLIVQNALPTKMALATSSLSFFRLIGATVGIAVMGSLMTSTYPGAFQSALPAAVRQVVPPAARASFNDPNAILNHAGSGLPTMQNPHMVALITDAMKQGLAQICTRSLHSACA